MDAPLRSDPFTEKVREEEQDAVEMKSLGKAERTTHVANAALRKAMKETTTQLVKKRPFLAAFIKPHGSLEENFFRLMDLIHLIAKVQGKDQKSQAKTEKQ